MKYIYWILTIFLIIPTITIAQEMSVKSFCLAEKDLTANTPGTIVYDQNGNVCALIKVETTIDGFTFDVGSLGVCEVKRVGGELWVYVPFGIRRITLSHPQLGVIRDYQLPCSVEKDRTYIMSLIAGTVRTIIEHTTSKQFQELITFKVGDIITEKSGGANIEKWEHFGSSSNFVQIIQNGKQLIAKKSGNFKIWGYINNSPKLLDIRIVRSDLITLSTKNFKIRKVIT